MRGHVRLVGAVLVHFRFWPDVRRPLDALLGQTRPPDHVMVIDDCSGDGSAEALARAYPGVEVHVAPVNRGCVANFNAGLEQMLARGVDAVLLLTHETEMEPDALERLAARLEEEPRVGAVGPLIGFLSAPDTVFSAGGMLIAGSWQNPHAGMYEPLREWRGRGPRRVPWLDTACVLLRATALRDTGLLEERYFHYYDDVQLGVQLNQRGWAVECLCDAVARQEPGLLAEYYRVRNRLGFLRETAPRRVLARAVAAHLRQMRIDWASSRRDLAVAQARALRDFTLGRWGRAPAAYVAARRRDHATGGALHEPPEPSWASPLAGFQIGPGDERLAAVPEAVPAAGARPVEARRLADVESG
jgi:GT2 family glycosyltransferase